MKLPSGFFANATYRSTTTCTGFMELMAAVLDEMRLKNSISLSPHLGHGLLWPMRPPYTVCLSRYVECGNRCGNRHKGKVGKT